MKIKEMVQKAKARVIPAMVGAMAVVSLAVPAFAVEGDVGAAEAVTSGLGVFTATVGTLTSNPILLAILGLGLIPLGFKIFKSAKRAVK